LSIIWCYPCETQLPKDLHFEAAPISWKHSTSQRKWIIYEVTKLVCTRTLGPWLKGILFLVFKLDQRRKTNDLNDLFFPFDFLSISFILFTKFQHCEIKINFHYFFHKVWFSQSPLFCSQNTQHCEIKIIFHYFFHKIWFSQSLLFCSQNFNIVRLKLIFIIFFTKF
jgi:hypothetical protein